MILDSLSLLSISMMRGRKGVIKSTVGRISWSKNAEIAFSRLLRETSLEALSTLRKLHVMKMCEKSSIILGLKFQVIACVRVLTVCSSHPSG